MTSEPELLEMLAGEADRRTEAIISGIEKLIEARGADPEAVERLRREAHGLKGATSVVGQTRLAALSALIESTLKARREEGTIDPTTARALIEGASALREGSRAAADDSTEPPSVAAAIESLEHPARPARRARPR